MCERTWTVLDKRYSAMCTRALQLENSRSTTRRRITWLRFLEQSGSESSSTSHPFSQRSIPLFLCEVRGRLEQTTDQLSGCLQKAKRLTDVSAVQAEALVHGESENVLQEKETLNFLASAEQPLEITQRIQSSVKRT